MEEGKTRSIYVRYPTRIMKIREICMNCVKLLIRHSYARVLYRSDAFYPTTRGDILMRWALFPRVFREASYGSVRSGHRSDLIAIFPWPVMQPAILLPPCCIHIARCKEVAADLPRKRGKQEHLTFHTGQRS